MKGVRTGLDNNPKIKKLMTIHWNMCHRGSRKNDM